jgi:hypothetical protein
MYHALLDDMTTVASTLAIASCIGTHRKRHDNGDGGFPDRIMGSTWHFSGSFWWFRNRDLFSNPKWREIQPKGWFGEAYLSFLFPYSQSRCLAYEELVNPYDPAMYAELPIADDPSLPAPIAPGTGLRIELGGGRKPRRNGFINVDCLDDPSVDVRVDFERIGTEGVRLPFDDDAVDEVYSSHCLEHVWPYKPLLHEIVRICRVGARVEIRVPHWNHSMALCNDHKHTLSPEQVAHWCNLYIDDWWQGCLKRLRLAHTEFVPSTRFAEAKELFPQMTDEQIMRFIPDTCHENRFHFDVVKHP